MLKEREREKEIYEVREREKYLASEREGYDGLLNLYP